MISRCFYPVYLFPMLGIKVISRSCHQVVNLFQRIGGTVFGWCTYRIVYFFRMLGIDAPMMLEVPVLRGEVREDLDRLAHEMGSFKMRRKVLLRWLTYTRGQEPPWVFPIVADEYNAALESWGLARIPLRLWQGRRLRRRWEWHPAEAGGSARGVGGRAGVSGRQQPSRGGASGGRQRARGTQAHPAEAAEGGPRPEASAVCALRGS